MSSYSDEVYKNIGVNLRQIRTKNGISQEKLSEILDVNSKFIGHVERFERYISLKRLIQLAEYFKVDVDYFFKRV